MEPTLKLADQICFPVYAASRLIIRKYTPYLDELGLSYPQYLVMLVLWEEDQVPVSFIVQKLLLNTNTITPLLQRLEAMGMLTRKKSQHDERKVIVSLTAKGRKLKEQAATIPSEMAACLLSKEITAADLGMLVNKLNQLIATLNEEDAS
ncbi:MarR family winged helix-turn-helix transcriptional regulator [Chitinophaga sp. sic0106]|uniref:MarR family winged helix-turn-helix transcriptional regulator n=1 Tax=Chitinophaga sp. sic0106 TaxID=2854785 RepID=UPI001C454D3D|nr:MarR family transcriptional regulator [Chitinophaga sp. sic0106]MBV7533135.1 MarR family transcriptional regulator [Chitinophaga sp. sic0106]